MYFCYFIIMIHVTVSLQYFGDVGMIQNSNLNVEERQGMMDAFMYGIKTFNSDQSDTIEKIELRFAGNTNVTDIDNSFQLTSQICYLMSKSLLLIVADSSPRSMEVYESISSRLNVPIVLSRGPGYLHKSPYVFDMMPSYTGAIIDIIQYFWWKSVYYVYDSEQSLRRIQEIYASQKSAGKRAFSLRPKRIENISDSYEILRSIDKHRYCDVGTGDGFSCHMRIVLDLSSKEAYNLTLEQIINVGMNRDEYHYILGGLGIKELDLSAFEYGGVNITGFAMLNSHSSIYDQLNSIENQNVYPKLHPLTIDKALMIDAISFIGAGFRKHMETTSNQQMTRITNCYEQQKYPSLGSRLAEAMKQVKIQKGLTGQVAFDENGQRKDYYLEVYQMGYKSKLKKVGEWSPNKPNGQRFETSLKAAGVEPWTPLQSNRTWRIATKLGPPFVQMVTSVHSDEKTKGVTDINGTLYEGYCIELIQRIKEKYQEVHKTEFNYKFHFVADNKFGTLDNETYRWDGMIGEIIENKTDLALSSLTITKDRQRVVDFTTPFMSIGISIMIKKPDKQKPGVFSFMDPLNEKVWICVMVGFLAVSLVLFFVGRWSPYEWREVVNSRDQANVFTFSNTLWFALGALMRQGSDIFPRSMSGRIVGSAWWFFTLILISSYTANLAAFLTIERLLTPIQSADDLVNQNKISYGIYRNGATEQFFRQTKVSTFEKMWKYMSANKDAVMVKSDDDGIKKVRKSKHDYAYLLESARNNYESQKKPCNTMKVGENLDTKGYGIAVAFPLAELRKNLTLIILNLNQEGELYRLEQRWWYDKGECGASESKDGKKSALTLSNVSGIFHILIGGLVIAMCVALFEFVIHSVRKKQKKKYKPPVKSSVKIEKKNPLEVLKAAGYSEIDNSGYLYSPPDYDHLRTFGDGPTQKSDGPTQRSDDDDLL